MTQYKMQEDRYNKIKDIISIIRKTKDNNRKIQIKLLSSLLYNYLNEQGYKTIERKLLKNIIDSVSIVDFPKSTKDFLITDILKVLLEEKKIKLSTREKKTLSMRRQILSSSDDSYKTKGSLSVTGNNSILAYYQTDVISCYELL